MKKAIITGITGQDGSFLAELLLDKGYEVYGFVRRETFEKIYGDTSNIAHLKNKITLIPVSTTDPLSLYIAISKIMPDEFYHLAAYSFVSYEMTDEVNMLNVNFNSTLYILTALKELHSDCRLFFAGSSEIFGNPEETPQHEESRFNPKSIYGIAKLASYYLLKNAREKTGLYAVTGLMYNHESARRGSQFVTKKIVSTAVKIKQGLADKIVLGNLDAKRDWGYAPDYVYAIWLMLQQDKGDDYIVATGRLHTVRDFLDTAFSYLDLDYNDYIEINKDYYRETEKIPLCGNPAKIKSIGWKETKTFEEIITSMIDAEFQK